MANRNYRDDLERLMKRGVNYFDAKRMLIKRMEQVKSTDWCGRFEDTLGLKNECCSDPSLSFQSTTGGDYWNCHKCGKQTPARA